MENAQVMIEKNTAAEKLDDDHVVKMWTPYHIQVDETYPFLASKAFTRVNNAVKAIAIPILSVINKVAFHLEIEGKENLSALNGKGYITVCNHVNMLDCAMIATAVHRNDIVFTTIKENFEIPVVRHFVKLLGAIPIPRTVKAMQKFSEAVETLLKKGQVVHFYPEGVLFPYYNGLRKFKRGAFNYAGKFQVPIVPMVITYHAPKTAFRKKPTAKIHVLPPVYPDASLSERERIQALRTEVTNSMQEKFDSVDCLRDNTEVLEKYKKA